MTPDQVRYHEIEAERHANDAWGEYNRGAVQHAAALAAIGQVHATLALIGATSAEPTSAPEPEPEPTPGWPEVTMRGEDCPSLAAAGRLDRCGQFGPPPPSCSPLAGSCHLAGPPDEQAARICEVEDCIGSIVWVRGTGWLHTISGRTDHFARPAVRP